MPTSKTEPTEFEPPSVPALYAFLLGSVASGSLIIAFLQHESAPNLTPFAVYLGSLALFHFLEYYWQAKYHPKTTTSEAFLLNHSKEYLMALITGILEYSLKRLLRISPVFLCFQLLGLTMVAFGILLRSMAMITAAGNFSHVIREDLSKGHKLVTDGIYALCRHPSYLGFFTFAVGGQIILGNYISTAIFVFVLQKFFRQRIIYEEATLLRAYPKEYFEYKSKTCGAFKLFLTMSSSQQPEFIKYPSTDDSVESLLHRPESPINRNWSWSPHAPDSHHIIQNINYRGDDHPLGNVPYETIEASEKILPKQLEDTDEEGERRQEQQDEINKKIK